MLILLSLLCFGTSPCTRSWIVEAATLEQHDPTLGHGGYPTQAGSVTLSTERKLRVAVGQLAVLTVISPASVSHFAGGRSLVLAVKSPAFVA